MFPRPRLLHTAAANHPSHPSSVVLGTWALMSEAYFQLGSNDLSDQYTRLQSCQAPMVNEEILHNSKTARVTADFGASYFIGGQRFVTLILFLKYFDEELGDLVTECLYNIVTDPDERSEDAFYVRAVWEHHLGTSMVFDQWEEIILERDGTAGRTSRTTTSASTRLPSARGSASTSS